MTAARSNRGLGIAIAAFAALLFVAATQWRTLADANFMPHGTCYRWEPGVVWLHVISDGLIFLSYVAISSILVLFVLRRRDLPFDWMFMMFGAFIVACGIGHLLDVIMIWKPMYWLSGSERALTATVSVATAIVLVPLFPKAMALPSPAELRGANKKLEAEIAERTLAESELERALALLKEQQQALLRSEKLAAVGELAASVGHELRNPLAAVGNALSYVTRRVTRVECPALDARVPELMGVMERELDKANKIIASMLDFARERVPVRHPCLLAPLVDDAIAAVGASGVPIENRVPRDLPIPRLDGDQFQQAIVNLLQNAVDATSPGSASPVTVTAEGGGARPWAIEVTDRGGGIPADALPRIFEPLYTSKVKGTGLGLAIVKKIVVAHGGEVSVSSSLGGGTTVTIVLPAASAEIAIAERA